MIRVNEEIKSELVKVIQKETKELATMSLSNAIALAEQTDEDVIMVSISDGVPVVKIEDYSKFAYKEQKRKREQAKKQRANNISLKEIRMMYSIEEHDLNVKAKNIDRLLADGNRVKISIIYKGRAVRMVHKGFEIMDNLKSKLTTSYKVYSDAKIEGNRVVMTIVQAK